METERQVYINGNLVPESEARISVFDMGFLYGVTLYESLRTFKHRWFAPDAHWTRLERSLRYAGLAGALTREAFLRILDTVLEANEHLTDPEDDLWGNIQVTPGRTRPMPLLGQEDTTPTILSYTCPLPYSAYVQAYTEGTHAVTARFRAPSHQSCDPRTKNRNRFPHFLAGRDARRWDPQAFALMLDPRGCVAEGAAANIFFVSDGVLYTPHARHVLAGVSRLTVMHLAQQLGVAVKEDDLTLYDAYNADEAFWTTSSYCVLPIARIDGRPLAGPCPGPLTRRLLDAWGDSVGVDIVGQARRFAR
ncbi:MAG: aminotransferase class IV [Lentisphaerae bacterium]|nr:aminotransferase class IV [Lentisphaerota bacterium]